MGPSHRRREAGRQRPTRRVLTIDRIALVGTHLPRQCGIATFTADLVSALHTARPELDLQVVPITDVAHAYAYPEGVRFDIPQDSPSAYAAAARFLNMSDVDVICLQHEFGIFGGPAGSYVLDLLEALRVPIVTTLHTVLRDPDPVYRDVMREVVTESDRVVVMSRRAQRYVQDIYGAAPAQIDVIPHGVPDRPDGDPEIVKQRYGLAGKHVLLTFGLLSPNKGIEHVIGALPRIVSQHPDLIYVVLGAVHPKARGGDAYLHDLRRMAVDLGVAGHVRFDTRFVDLAELVDVMTAADVYLTPYLSRAQIVSGTLAYAVGMGKAVVSTPYWYAEELLADDRGRLVPFGDPAAVAGAVTELLGDEVLHRAMCRRAYALGRTMRWPAVAEQYLTSMERSLEAGPTPLLATGTATPAA